MEEAIQFRVDRLKKPLVASSQKHPYQDGLQSGRQQGQQEEVVSLDRLIPVAFPGASVLHRPSN